MTSSDLNRSDNILRPYRKRQGLSLDFRTTEEIEDAADKGEDWDGTKDPVGMVGGSYSQLMIDWRREN